MTQPPAPQTPSPAIAPASPGTGRTLGHVPGTNVYTVTDIAALRGRLGELTRQLSSTTNRRREVHDQLRRADGTERAGLEQRLTVLDARIAGIEGDIAESERLLATPEAQRVTANRDFTWNPAGSANRIERNAVPIAMLFIIFVLSPIAISISRILWRRGSLRRQPTMHDASADRLERMEQAIDAIAVEVERVSEGQRFVTRLLSEARPLGVVGAGQPAKEPLRVGVREGVPTPR